MKKSMMKKEAVKTVTLNAQVAVSKTETGTNYVQVLPDNPTVGQVEAFRGLGYGQMLSTGAFEFTRHKIIRSQAVTLRKMPHSSLSHCKDGTHRFTDDLPYLLRQQKAQVCRPSEEPRGTDGAA